MTDRDAILEAIFAAPADDAPRLVYADWLDEHDYPEQATFVRRQIELFRTPVTDARWRERAAAVEACWNRFKIELLQSLPHTDVQMVLYARGLPEEYGGPADRFLLDAPNWWPLFPVLKLRLTGWVEQVGLLGQCDYLTRVTELILLGGVVDPAVARALIGSPVLTNVRRLRIWALGIRRPAARALREHFGDRLEGVS
ncbi:MAG TPA: TIGR02996 domain-containing protein [Gemmataceae bacterium]|nr:TIGR02996 domain-containing protein [Gemmataceae bacterium]